MYYNRGSLHYHILEELTQTSIYPPQRIEDKEGFLNAATIGSASGRNSGVYSNLLAMDSKQRHQWSFGVILAG